MYLEKSRLFNILRELGHSDNLLAKPEKLYLGNANMAYVLSEDGITFEVGGKNKRGVQLKGADTGYIVKDDIEYGMGNIIPIWMFGFLY